MIKNKLTRRDFLKVAGLTSVGLALSACGVSVTELPTLIPLPTLTIVPTATSTPTPSITPSPTQTPLPPTLRNLANRLGIKIGAQIIWEGIVDTHIKETYQKIASNEFNQLVMAGDFDWLSSGTGKSFRPDRNSFYFDKADVLVNFAMQKGMSIQAYHLIWGAYPFIPEWLIKGNYSQDELRIIIQEHIETVMGRYKDKITSWSVVNEPYPYSNGGDFWYDRLGLEYIDLAFETARKADPNSTLFLNDNSNEVITGQRSSFDYETVARLRKKTVNISGKEYPLIDSIGMQMHLDGSKPPSKENVIANMKRYGELGLYVIATEFDVDLTNVHGTQAEKFEIQAQIYRDMLEACLESGGCKSFNLFGFTDKISWYEFTGKPDANALPFDDNFQPKPAYYALRDTLLKYVQQQPSATATSHVP
jgi:endo-1,4-beta-xylanase